MRLQYTFFEHIVCNGSADHKLLARVALHLGHDPEAFPLRLADIAKMGALPRDHGSFGLNELLLSEFLKLAVTRGLEPWKDWEVEALKKVAKPEPLAAVLSLVRSS